MVIQTSIVRIACAEWLQTVFTDTALVGRKVRAQSTSTVRFTWRCAKTTIGAYVVVADNKNKGRLVLLDAALEYVDTIVEEFVEPLRLWFDSEARRLYVGQCSGNGASKVFKTE